MGTTWENLEGHGRLIGAMEAGWIRKSQRKRTAGNNFCYPVTQTHFDILVQAIDKIGMMLYVFFESIDSKSPCTILLIIKTLVSLPTECNNDSFSTQGLVLSSSTDTQSAYTKKPCRELASG